MPTTLNDDVLFTILPYANQSTLPSLCRVSRSLYGPAVRRMYKIVYLRRYSSLLAFLAAVERHDFLAAAVITFIRAERIIAA